MYDSLLNSTCKIERILGSENYDFSSSSYGEVDEIWDEIEGAEPCRLEVRSGITTARRQDGLVEVGGTVLYVKLTANILEGDRITHNNKFYVVDSVSTIPGFDVDHHKEVSITRMDHS